MTEEPPEAADVAEVKFLEGVARLIRNIRLKNGLSQADLADKLGARKSHIFELERGTANPTLRTLFRLSRALGIQPLDLIPGRGRVQLSPEDLSHILEQQTSIMNMLQRRRDESERFYREGTSLMTGVQAVIERLIMQSVSGQDVIDADPGPPATSDG